MTEGKDANGGAESRLPAGFEELERFAGTWALPSEQQRSRERLSRPVEQLSEFHSAMLERIDDALTLLEKHEPGDLDEKQRNLYHLTLSFCEVAPAVELFRQPHVVDGLDPDRFEPVHVPNMTPDEL